MSYGHGLQDWIPAASYCSSDSAFSEDDELSASVRTSAAIQYNELKGRDLARFKILTRVEDAGPKPGGSPEGLAPQISPQLVEEPQIKSYNLEIRRSRAMRCPKCH